MNADNEPISIDLAREADFSVGPVKVRPSLRQVESGGDSETLEPRVMQVLVALAQRRGEVVSRDELIQRCWGGRIVGEDAISRCIARVRKLAESSGSFSLETIPRVGYRLTASAIGEAPASEAPAPGVSQPSSRRWMWIAAGVAAVVVAIAGMLLLRGNDPDVDAVVAQLTERLRQQNASSRDIQRSVDAAAALGSSGRSEERSAFAALASGDSLQAIAVLEDLAAKLETRGEHKAAAEVLTRVGAIALVVDQGRGLAARRKAFQLDPGSLAAFQGLFFDASVLKGPEDALALVQAELGRTDLSPRMRGWLLAHLATAQTDSQRDNPAAEATLEELKAIHSETRDPVLEPVIEWISGLIAFNKDDLQLSRRHAEQALADWKNMPDGVSNAGEVMLVRALYAQGDRNGAFAMGAEALDRRGKTGDFLPTPVIFVVCEAGMFIGEVERATPFCEALARRNDPSLGAEGKAYAGLIAAAKGDADLARTEFAAGHAIDAAGPVVPVRLMFFEGWAAMKAGDMAKGEELMTAVAKRLEESQFAVRYRSFRAHVLWLLGEGFIANGEAVKACAPLDASRALYAEVGGDAGRAAVEALFSAAGCSR